MSQPMSEELPSKTLQQPEVVAGNNMVDTAPDWDLQSVDSNEQREEEELRSATFDVEYSRDFGNSEQSFVADCGGSVGGPDLGEWWCLPGISIEDVDADDGTEMSVESGSKHARRRALSQHNASFHIDRTDDDEVEGRRRVQDWKRKSSATGPDVATMTKFYLDTKHTYLAALKSEPDGAGKSKLLLATQDLQAMHKVPLEHQGNDAFYNAESIQKRYELRQDPTLIGAVKELWDFVPKVAPPKPKKAHPKNKRGPPTARRNRRGTVAPSTASQLEPSIDDLSIIVNTDIPPAAGGNLHQEDLVGLVEILPNMDRSLSSDEDDDDNTSDTTSLMSNNCTQPADDDAFGSDDDISRSFDEHDPPAEEEEKVVNFNVFRAFSAHVFHRLIPAGTMSEFTELIKADFLKACGVTEHESVDLTQTDSVVSFGGMSGTSLKERRQNMSLREQVDCAWDVNYLWLDKNHFINSVIDVVDVWTNSLSVDEYVRFAREVLKPQAKRIRHMAPDTAYDLRHAFVKGFTQRQRKLNPKGLSSHPQKKEHKNKHHLHSNEHSSHSLGSSFHLHHSTTNFNMSIHEAPPHRLPQTHSPAPPKSSRSSARRSPSTSMTVDGGLCHSSRSLNISASNHLCATPPLTPRSSQDSGAALRQSPKPKSSPKSTDSSTKQDEQDDKMPQFTRDLLNDILCDDGSAAHVHEDEASPSMLPAPEEVPQQSPPLHKGILCERRGLEGSMPSLCSSNGSSSSAHIVVRSSTMGSKAGKKHRTPLPLCSGSSSRSIHSSASGPMPLAVLDIDDSDSSNLSGSTSSIQSMNDVVLEGSGFGRGWSRNVEVALAPSTQIVSESENQSTTSPLPQIKATSTPKRAPHWSSASHIRSTTSASQPLPASRMTHIVKPPSSSQQSPRQASQAKDVKPHMSPSRHLHDLGPSNLRLSSPPVGALSHSRSPRQATTTNQPGARKQ